jgi:cell division protein FtsL
MSQHKKFWKFERKIYRILIVLCTIALVLAILAMYFFKDGGII